MTTPKSCPTLQISKIWSTLGRLKYIFVVCLIGIGAVECFFGQKFFRPSLIFFGFLTGCFTIIIVLGEFAVTSITEDKVVYIILAVAITSGSMLAYICFKEK